MTDKKEDSLKKTKKKLHITDIILWVLSIIGMFLSIGAFTSGFLPGFFVLLSALIILPPFYKLYSKKIKIRLRYVLIIWLILLFIAGYISPPSGYTTEGSDITETKRVFPEELEVSSDMPELQISYNCLNVNGIKINNVELSEEKLEEVCSKKYSVVLKDGENIYVVEIKSPIKTISETIKVTFDKEKYETDLVAKKEAEAKLEEERRVAAEAENAKALSQWKVKYEVVKRDIIEVSFTKSAEMNDVLSSGRDAYTTRNNAKAYNNYFLSSCNKNLEEQLSPVPESLKIDVEKLNGFYRDFCMYNEFVARNVVDYLQTSSVSKQYSYLDQISYNMKVVTDNKFSMQVHMLAIEDIIK